MARRRGSFRRRTTRRRSRTKNWFPTKIPTSMSKVRYQWKQLQPPSKVAVACLGAGIVGGVAAAASIEKMQIPIVGKYMVALTMYGAKLGRKA